MPLLRLRGRPAMRHSYEDEAWEERARSIALNLSRAADELSKLIEDYRKAREEKDPDDRPQH